MTQTGPGDSQPPAGPTRVLVIEDDAQVRRVLRFLLQQEGYVVIEAGDGGRGLERAAAVAPEVILLDLGLPDMDGIEIAAELASRKRHAVIVVSARDQEEQKVRALDRGAMDYITKPFGHAELLARIRAAIRHLRGSGHDASVFTFGDFSIDFNSARVSLAGRDIELSPTEFKLLRCLVRGRGTIVRHEELLREVWGPMAVHELHYLRVYVKRLRSKLETDPARPTYILTEPSLGYRFGTG